MSVANKSLPCILHLEDNQNDCVLVREMLMAEEIACEMVAVKTRSEFESALRQGGFDLIISDYSLPSFDGLTALSVAQEMSPHVPFIFFSATIGEEAAVQSLKNGATDYVLKQRPHRLVPAIRSALRNVEERTRLKSLENTLQQIEERFRIVARATNDVVWEWDIKTNRVWFSENFRTVFGHSPEEIGATLERWVDLIHPDDKGRVISGVTALLAGGGRVWWSEHRFRRGSGSYAHILDRASIIYDSGGRPLRMVGVTIDLTERKHAEEKIREQAALLDHARDAIIVCDIANGRVLYWNQGAARIYGWAADEAIGQTIETLVFAGNPPPELEEVIKAVRERGEWLGELNETTKTGRAIIVQARASLIRDEKGQPKSSLIINTDLTSQKHLEEQLLRAQRLESLGVLVAGIAHDLNNTLSPILIGLNMLRTNPLSANENILITMEGAAKRSADMLRQMLTFSRGGEASKTIIHADLLLKEMARIVTATFSKNINCELQLEENTYSVHGFATQLHQVLMNLCVNARDAMPKGGTLTLAAENASVDAATASQHEGVKPGNFLRLTVADTGVGISEEQMSNIFQMFFTTKEAGKGTGLGLPTSLNIVKKHGGFITVQSRVGEGTKFHVFLPAAVEAAVEIFQNRPSLPTGNGEHILLVDDEESILAIMRTALENYGYKVSTAASAPEAIARIAGSSDINLLITDLAMPFMDGFAMVAAVRRLRLDVKIIASSGANRAEEVARDPGNIDAFLIKPVTTEALLQTVHQVLARKK